MKRRPKGRPLPPRSATSGPLPSRTSHTTVPAQPVPKHAKPPLRVAKRATVKRQPLQAAALPPRRDVARIADDDEASLLDLIDNLLGKGVMLNADLILALADVDLVYVRLSALLCAADRVLPPAGKPRR